MVDAEERHAAPRGGSRKSGFKIGDDEIGRLNPDRNFESPDQVAQSPQVSGRVTQRLEVVQPPIRVVKQQAGNPADSHFGSGIGVRQYVEGRRRGEQRELVLMPQRFDDRPHAGGMSASLTGHAVEDARHDSCLLTWGWCGVALQMRCVLGARSSRRS